jgi:hypothetical protein
VQLNELHRSQAGSVTLAQQGWSLEIDGLSSIKAKVRPFIIAALS